jgi:hypothetical protein
MKYQASYHTSENKCLGTLICPSIDRALRGKKKFNKDHAIRYIYIYEFNEMTDSIIEETKIIYAYDMDKALWRRQKCNQNQMQS